jgi:hypothetical protein
MGFSWAFINPLANDPPDLNITVTGLTATSSLAAQGLTASVSGGFGAYTYAWTAVQPDGDSSTSEFSTTSGSTTLFTPAAVGLYSVTCTVTDQSTVALTASANQSKVIGTDLSATITGIADSLSVAAQDVTASVTGGTGGESYTWSVVRPDNTTSTTEYSNFSTSPLSQSATFTVSQKGLNVLRVRIADDSGAIITTTSSVKLGVTGSDLNVSASGLVATSSLAPQNLSSSVTGGISPYNFSWSSVRPDGSTSTSEFSSTTVGAPIFSPQRVGLYSVTCTVTDTPDTPGTGLTASSTQTKFIGEELSAVITGLTGTGSTAAQALTASATGGTGSYSYAWSVVRPDGTTSTSEFSGSAPSSSVFFTVGYAGHNVVRCDVTDASAVTFRATSSAEIGITGSDLSIVASGFAARSDLNAQSLSTVVTGGIEPYVYAWSNVRPDGNVSTSEFNNATVASPTFTPARVGLNTVTCTVTDASTPGLTASSAQSKVVGTELSVTITGISATSSVASQDVTASVVGGTGGESYIWSNNNFLTTGSTAEYSNFSTSPLSKSATFTPQVVGLNTLSVRVTDNSGTAFTASLSLALGVTGSDFSLSTAGLAATSSLAPQNLTATAKSGSGTYTFSWSATRPDGSTSTSEFSSATAQNPTFNPLRVGLYSVTCTATDTSTPALTATSTQAKFIGVSLSNTINGAAQTSSMAPQDLTASTSGGTGSYSYNWTVVQPPGFTSSAGYSNFSTSPLSQSVRFSPSIPGLHVFRVNVTDQGGGSVESTASVAIGITGSDFSLTTAGFTATASLAPQSLTATAKSGAAPYSFSWTAFKSDGTQSTSEFNNATTQNPTFTPKAIGLYTIVCTATDSSVPALTASSSQSGFIGQALAVSITGLATTSSVAAQDLTASTSGGSGSYNYTWSSLNPNNVSDASDFSNFSTVPLSQSAIFSASIQGVNVVSVRVTDQANNLVVATASAFIGVTSSGGGAGDLFLSASGLAAASNLNAQNLTATAVGGTAPLAFSWRAVRPDGSDSTSEFNNAATQNPTFTPARVGTYTVVCTVSDNATPKLSASHPQSAFVGTALAGKITSSAGGAIDTTDFTTQELTASQTGAGTGGESYVWEVLRPDGTSGSTEYSSFSTSPLSQSCIFTPAQKGIHVHSVRMTDSSGEFVILTASADYGTEIPYNRIQVMDFDGWTIVTGSLANTNEAEACFITCENGIVTYGHTPIIGNVGEVPTRNLTEPKQFPVQLYSPENYLQNRLAPAMHSLGKEGKAGVLFLTMETVPNEDGTGKTSFSGLASGSIQSGGPRLICAYGIVSQPYNGDDLTPDFTLMEMYGYTSTTSYAVQPRLAVGNENENVKTLTNRSPGNASRVHLDAAIFIENRGDPSIITVSPRESDGTVYSQENDSGTATDFSANVTGSRLYVGIGLASTSTCTDASGSFRLFWNFVASQSGSSEP